MTKFQLAERWWHTYFKAFERCWYDHPRCVRIPNDACDGFKKHFDTICHDESERTQEVLK